jgi:VWFA-related protein
LQVLRHTAAFFALVSGTTLLAQQPVSIRTDVNLVELGATVTDKEGRLVAGLGDGAFQLLVDDVPQLISVFRNEDAPATVGIVIDNSASMASKRDDVIGAALAFARASNPEDQMFVVHFNDLPRFGLPEGAEFTGNILELETAIAAFHLGGTTALYDALMIAQEQLAKGVYRRKVLLTITDGGDNSSRATLSDVSRAALKAGILIYSIGIFDETDRDRNPQVLAKIAQQTGGQAYFPERAVDAAKICVGVAGEIRRQYTIGFPGANDGQFHRLHVIATDQKYGHLDVHTRSGYYATGN